MSNPDFPSCLLPSAKCGWGHAECSLLRRPDGSCKIEQFCLLKHQLFSKISIGSRMAARLLILRAQAVVGKRCRLCSTAEATCQPRSCEKSLQQFQSCRKASPAAPYGLRVLGTAEKGFSRPPGHWPALQMAPRKSHEVKQSSSLVRSGTRSAEVSPGELKLSSLQDVALADHSTRQEFFQKLQRQLPVPKELGFRLLLEMEGCNSYLVASIKM